VRDRQEKIMKSIAKVAGLAALIVAMSFGPAWAKKLYVGNLPLNVTINDLNVVFSQYGIVTDISLPKDQLTGRLRGFGFVTIPSNDEADAAIAALHNSVFMGRPIVVQVQPELEQRPPGGAQGNTTPRNQRGGQRDRRY
jgi:cold-inducible RNA-binding protein